MVDRARDVLAQLEDTQRSGNATKLIDDLPLFSAEPKQPPKRDTSESDLIKALEDLHPDELTPREALDALYELRSKILKQR